MARPTISQRIALEGGDQIKRALTDLGKAGEDAFAQAAEGRREGQSERARRPPSRQPTRRASATVDELRQRMAGAGGAASQSGAGLRQFGGVVQSDAAAPGRRRQCRRAGRARDAGRRHGIFRRVRQGAGVRRPA